MDSFLFSKIQVGETNDSGIPATATCPNLSPPPPVRYARGGYEYAFMT